MKGKQYLCTRKMYEMMKKKQIFAGMLLMLPLMTQAIELNDSSKVFDLDEVIVVSQPKEGRLLRHQPLSSTVMTQQEMRQLQVCDLGMLSDYVPSFNMPQYGSRLTSSLYIRGIGSRINNPSVGIYYDNIPLVGKSAFNHYFYMIDRVDVLRGPQGTLYGMNTEGGLVRIYSKDPMRYQGTDISLGMGTGLTRHVEVAHFHRPTEKFAFSAAGFYNGQRGFFKNSALDEWNDKMTEAGGKMRFALQATPKLRMDLTTDYQYTNQNGFPYGLYNIEENSVDRPATTTMNTYKRQMLNTGLNIGYDAGPWLLTSITSWQYLRDHMEMDQDYMVADYMHLKQLQKQNALTQELTLRSHGQHRWQWVVGAFGSYQWLRTDAPVSFGSAMKQQTADRIKGLMPPAVAAMLTAWEIPDFSVSETFHTPNANVGVFHESTFSVTNRFDVTLGLRYDYSRVKVDYNTNGLLSLHYAMPAMPPRMPVAVDKTNRLTGVLQNNDKRSFHQLLPKVGLTYRVDDQGSNIYATVSKGYRAGGYNIQMFSEIYQSEFMSKGKTLQNGDVAIPYDDAAYERINSNISYKPEESWNFEAGSHLNLLEGKVKADFAFFYMRIRNQQLAVMADEYNFGRIMVNAGRSHTMGIEMSLRGSAFDNRFDWFGNLSALDAVFDDYDTFSGNTVPFIPLCQFSLGGNWHIGKLTLGANVTGQGDTFWDEANTFSQSAYVLLGAHADYNFGVVSVSLWGRNLTNKHYNQFAIKSRATGSELAFAQRGTPIHFGADVNIHF